MAAKNITIDDVTNVDETGIQEGESRAGKVLGSVLIRHPEVKQSSATTWVTIIEAIVANGRRLTPAIIFTGRSLQGQWFPDTIAPWMYDHTPTGGVIAVSLLDG